jgi:enoyl-CoA hydratase/carnithine racemase
VAMSYSEILYDVADRVATVTLNRPDKLNAWTLTMEAEVQDAMLKSDRDENVRVIVLTGAGRGFCAGADMGSLDSVAKTSDPLEAVNRLREKFKGPAIEGARADFQKTYSYFFALSKPVIAAINGAAAGLGMVIPLYCDLRFASDKAKFSTAFSRRGLIAEYGMSWLLPRIVGIANALDLLYSARLIDAAEADRMGLVNRVIPENQFAAEVRKYAVELATSCSPRSMKVMKRQVYNALLSSLGEAIDEASEEMIASLQCEEFKEGVAHFLEKRAPNFTGR